MGTVGTLAKDTPSFYVPSRTMTPPSGSGANLATFVTNTQKNGNDVTTHVTLNLGNSLPTASPGGMPNWVSLGELRLVDLSQGGPPYPVLASLPYNMPGFSEAAGILSCDVKGDFSKKPLGVESRSANGSALLLAEDGQGYSLSLNQLVFRMNPGVAGDGHPNPNTATIDVYATAFGEPVPDGTEVECIDDFAMLQASTVPGLTLGNPPGALTIDPPYAATVGGKATFTMTATDPGNPRGYIDGQIYFKKFQHRGDPAIWMQSVGSVSNTISVHVYDEKPSDAAINMLNQYGRIYPIMAFLEDDKRIEEIDFRNMIKLLLQRPLLSVTHMPVTRDLSEARRKIIIDWINALNQL